MLFGTGNTNVSLRDAVWPGGVPRRLFRARVAPRSDLITFQAISATTSDERAILRDTPAELGPG
jgi:hypothetical protein